MIDVGIIIGSTRPGRKGEAVAQWVHKIAEARGDARYSLIDIAAFDLPLLDEPIPASQNKYSKDHTKRWAAAIAPLDAFVFVMPEYNHGISGALKNAIDFLYKEWTKKPAGFVGYGGNGAVRSVEQLRLVAASLDMATVAAQVVLSLRTDFENFSTFRPAPYQEGAVKALLDQLIPWGTALKSLRTG